MERRAYPVSACQAIVEAHDLETGRDYVRIVEFGVSETTQPSGAPIIGLLIICGGCVLFGMLLGWLLAEAF